MKFLIHFFLLFTMAVATSSLHAKDRKQNTKSIRQQYQAHCERKAQMAMDKARLVCQCMVHEMIQKVSDQDLAKLTVDRPELSEEEAAKVENFDADLNSLQILEMEIAEGCVSPHKAHSH